MKIHPNTSMKYSTITTSMRCIHIRFSRCVCVCILVFSCMYVWVFLSFVVCVSLCAVCVCLCLCVWVRKRLAMGDNECETCLTWLSIPITRLRFHNLLLALLLLLLLLFILSPAALRLRWLHRLVIAYRLSFYRFIGCLVMHDFFFFGYLW